MGPACATGGREADDESGESESSEAAESSNDEEVAALPGIPEEDNERVDRWIKYFSEMDKERFRLFLKRGSQYKEVVEGILEEVGVPGELYYLAMIESGYQTHATSRARAVGAWQFMHATGKRYGLEFNKYVDDRRDPIRSTEAAGRYLRDLYNVFGSWQLALAAYNAGEARVMKAVMEGKSRNFWELYSKGVLPKETAEYVPKFFAAVTVGRNLEKYGFDSIQEAKYPSMESVEVPPSMPLARIAQMTGIPKEDLDKANPQLRKQLTPPNQAKYEIWVPEDHMTAMSAAIGAIWKEPVVKIPERKIAAARSDSKRYWKVRKGDTLVAIARKSSISVAYLKSINGLRSNRVVAGRRLRLTARSYNARRAMRYRVQPGDSLSSIARKYRVSVRSLKKLNSLEHSRIRVGQSLRVGKPKYEQPDSD